MIANHGSAACKSLARIGVIKSKIVAWDWPQDRTPDHYRPKKSFGAVFKLLFVGSVIESKGVGDVVRALPILVNRDIPIEVTFVGDGQIAEYEALAARLNVGGHVQFVGRISNSEVFGFMLNTDAVVVPSRHSSPEGLPLTIYEALCSRTPIICSDHPMFVPYLVDGRSALVFRSGDPADLAASVERLYENNYLYQRLSENSSEAWSGIQVRTKWGELVTSWVRGNKDDKSKLNEIRLRGF
ncbi:glycosyltransferase [Alsobacter sp. KACC 23698]|uniref:Glycosyltransferase n=1 Tax=Alsobacter sp. KACC 23698 TaxID=3149229 RepID=A0AAU7JJE5_9HYPH